MAEYQRKTRDVYTIQQYTGAQYGWEDVAEEYSLKEAKAQLKTYQENQAYPVRLFSRREKPGDDEPRIGDVVSWSYRNPGGSGPGVVVGYTGLDGWPAVRVRQGSSRRSWNYLVVKSIDIERINGVHVSGTYMQFYVIEFVQHFSNPDVGDVPTGPLLVQKGRRNGEDTIEWGGGPYRNWPADTTILDDRLCQSWDEAELWFLRTYKTLVSELRVSAGWLSPEGKFYPCAFEAHKALSALIGAQLFNEYPFGGYDLEKRDWVKIDASGYVYTKGSGLTQAQLDTLFDLSLLAAETDERYAKYIRRCLSVYKEE